MTQSVVIHGPLTGTPSPPSVETRGVSQAFDGVDALSDVSMSVRSGEVRALLGPNGAGKTTLLRTLMGLLIPTSGHVRVLGLEPAQRPLALRSRVAFVPSGDRSLYLRISGLENLRFFARLSGMPVREALQRSHAALEDVGLTDAGGRAVKTYSHGMQKRLSVARALLTRPEVLLVDEATHDLDPEAADQVRFLVRRAAENGCAVIWTTQRIDEIRGLADVVTLMRGGRVCFEGSVPLLMEHATLRAYVLRIGDGPGAPGAARMQEAVRPFGELVPTADEASGAAPYHSLRLRDDAVLGDAIAALVAAGTQVISCTEERSALEEAFRSLTGSAG